MNTDYKILSEIEQIEVKRANGFRLFGINFVTGEIKDHNGKLRKRTNLNKHEEWVIDCEDDVFYFPAKNKTHAKYWIAEFIKKCVAKKELEKSVKK